MVKDHRKKAKYIPLFVLLFIAAFFVFGYIVMGLWNWLIPTLFSGPVITFWQAIGIMVLSKLLFGGFRHGRHRPPRHFRNWKDRYRENYREKSDSEGIEKEV